MNSVGDEHASSGRSAKEKLSLRKERAVGQMGLSLTVFAWLLQVAILDTSIPMAIRRGIAATAVCFLFWAALALLAATWSRLLDKIGWSQNLGVRRTVHVISFVFTFGSWVGGSLVGADRSDMGMWLFYAIFFLGLAISSMLFISIFKLERD